MFGLRSWEWLIILVLILLLFGAKRLPELARSLGRSFRELKQSLTGVEKDEPDDTPPRPGNDRH